MSYLSPVTAATIGFDRFDPDCDDPDSVDRSPGDDGDDRKRYAHPLDADDRFGGRADRLEDRAERLEDRGERLEDIRDRVEDRFESDQSRDERCGRDRDDALFAGGWRMPITPM